MLFQVNLHLGRSALALPVALAVGGGALVWQLMRRNGSPERSFAVALATLLAVYGSVVMIGLPALERSRPTAPLARWSAHNTPSHR